MSEGGLCFQGPLEGPLQSQAVLRNLGLAKGNLSSYL